MKNDKIELHDGRMVSRNEMITKAGEKELQGNRGRTNLVDADEFIDDMKRLHESEGTDKPKKGEKK